MKDRKYADVLDTLLRAIEKRDGRKPTELAEKYKAATQEGMQREGIVQILSDEPFSFRWRMLFLYPELIIPYLCRVKLKKRDENPTP